MILSHWLKQLRQFRFAQSSSKRASTTKRRTAWGHQLSQRPAVEVLEDRTLLSGNPLSVPDQPNPADESAALQLFSTSTALFIENQGQWADEKLQYAYNGDGVNIGFSDAGLNFLLTRQVAGEETETDVVDDFDSDSIDPFGEEENFITESTQFSVQFDGANAVTPQGLNEAETRFNYFVGDESDWHADVPGYEVVAYAGLYSGIDLHTFGRRESLKYEFYVAPGADWQQIEISYTGINGLTIDDSGALHVATEFGDLIDDTPYIYQVINGEEVEVAGAFRLVDADTYAFEITGEYDPSIELVIDPDLVWSTYLGGSSSDRAVDVAVSSTGDVWVVGWSQNLNIPTNSGDSILPSNGGTDAFVVQLNSEGLPKSYNFLGGQHHDVGAAIAVDADGNAWVTGSSGKEFPTTDDGSDLVTNNRNDVFVAKISESGSLVYSRFLNTGSMGTFVGGIDVDGDGNIWVTGGTTSDDFPTTPDAVASSHSGGHFDVFITKLSSSGNTLYSTYLGGDGWDHDSEIVVDSLGNIWVTGVTNSSNFPTTAGAIDSSYNGSLDVFVTKLSSSGARLYSSYLGGTGLNWAQGIAIDPDDNAWITGYTYSNNFPTTPGAYDSTYNGRGDIFASKISTDGELLYSTFIGGTETDHGYGIAVDTHGNAWLTGGTSSTDYPTTLDAFNGTYYGEHDEIFVSKLNDSGQLLYSTYLSDTCQCEDDREYGFGIEVDSNGGVWVVGQTGTSGFPTTADAIDRTPNGGHDAFIAKLQQLISDLSITKTDNRVSVTQGETFTYTLTVTNNGPGYVIGATVTDIMPDGLSSMAYTSDTTGGGANGNTASGSGSINDTVNLPDGSTITYTITATITNAASITPLGGLDTDTDQLNNTTHDSDIVVLSTETKTAGIFLKKSQSFGSTPSEGVSLGDLDNDGDLDAFVNSGLANKVWLNLGNGKFVDSGYAIGSSTSMDVSLGDLDGDGDLDAFIVNDRKNNNKVWLNNGSGIFSDSGQAFGPDSNAVFLSDVDGDGDLDAFVTNFHRPNLPWFDNQYLQGGNTVWLNNGRGIFSDTGQALGSNYSYNSALGDLDGDGELDAFVANGFENFEKVWINDGNGTFTDSGQALDGADSRNIAMGDLDGDGDLDAFVTDTFEWNDYIWLNDGNGIFTRTEQSLRNLGGRDVALGDLDGDGDIDVFIANLYRPNAVWLNQNRDILVDSVSEIDPNQVTITYTIEDLRLDSLQIGLYHSVNTTFGNDDTLLDTLTISNAGDLTLGQHTKTFSTTAGATLASIEDADIQNGHFLLAVADPNDEIFEADHNPFNEDNTAFSGVYLGENGVLLIHGTDAADVITIELGSVNVTFNGETFAYDESEINSIRIRSHGGDDVITAELIPGVDLFILGGDGDDELIIHGTPADEQVILKPGELTLTGPAGVDAASVEEVRIDGNGGNDIARLFDSAGDDRFVSKSEYTLLRGDGFFERGYWVRAC